MTARALLVGVESSRARPGLAPLPGAADDARSMESLLQSRGFPRDNIKVAAADELNAAPLKQLLLDLATATNAGDLAVFYFSGHGYRVPDGSGDEPDDRWDECLALQDELLIDDWFRDVFWPRTQPGSKWVTCVDACYSGTSTRGIDVWFGGSDRDLIEQRRDLALRDQVAEVPGKRWRIGLTACSDGEETLETVATNNEPGLARGAMTRAVVSNLRHSPDLTYVGLWTGVESTVAAMRRLVCWLGTPQIWSSGPDDSLRNAVAFHET